MPETRNSSGMPHSEPHRRKTVNPGLDLGSLMNQEVPEANTMAEWKTTSPATTNARIASSSGRLEPAGTNPGPAPCGRCSILTTSLLLPEHTWAFSGAHGPGAAMHSWMGGQGAQLVGIRSPPSLEVGGRGWDRELVGARREPHRCRLPLLPSMDAAAASLGGSSALVAKRQTAWRATASEIWVASGSWGRRLAAQEHNSTSRWASAWGCSTRIAPSLARWRR